MRFLLRPLVFVLTLSSIAAGADAVFPGLQSVLTPTEWQRAGLDRLTPDQIGVIDAALIRHHLRAAPTSPSIAAASPPSAATPKPKPGLLERFGLTRTPETDWRTQPPLEARATAWLTTNRFALDNGQVWEGVETIPFDITGQEVVIAARPMESFALTLKSGSAPIRIRRVK